MVLPGDLGGGFYLTPCILEDVADSFSISNEEVFGAVMCLYRFHDDQEAVSRANNSQFGLAAGLFTRHIPH